MRGSTPLALHGDLRIRNDPLGLLRDRIVIGTDNDDGRAGRGFAYRIEHMRQQGAARRLVQHLGQRGAHAGSLARGKHDGQTGAGFVHSLGITPFGHSLGAGAVIDEPVLVEKTEGSEGRARSSPEPILLPFPC